MELWGKVYELLLLVTVVCLRREHFVITVYANLAWIQKLNYLIPPTNEKRAHKKGAVQDK